MENQSAESANQKTETKITEAPAVEAKKNEATLEAGATEANNAEDDIIIEKPDLAKIRNPITLVKTFWGEIRVAIILVVPTQLVQFFLYLFITDKYPSVNWPMFVIGVCLVGFVSFLFLDKQARDEKGASAGAFEVAVGYTWILFTLLFSLIGMAGESFLNSICKSTGCFATALGIGAFKDYALYILFEGLVMGIIVFFLGASRRYKEAEDKKSASISIAKPKKR